MGGRVSIFSATSLGGTLSVCGSEMLLRRAPRVEAS